MNYMVIECEICGFKHIIPLPEQEELDKLYKQEYYSSEKPLYFRESEEDLDWWRLHYNSYYDIFEKNICTNSKKLLEIGSGPGVFLKIGKEKGWNVMGFEPSELAYEYSKKFDVCVLNHNFNIELANKSGPFDVVYMETVIEHVVNPERLIMDIKSVLKEDGLFCIIAPNDYNPLQIILRDKLGFEPYWVTPPQHINYFDFDSMKNLLERCNFEIIVSLATFPMEFYLLSGQNYINNDQLGRECHFMRKSLETNVYNYNKPLLMATYNFLADNNIGREFFILSKNK